MGHYLISIHNILSMYDILNLSFDGVFFSLIFDVGDGVESVHTIFICETIEIY